VDAADDEDVLGNVSGARTRNARAVSVRRPAAAVRAHITAAGCMAVTWYSTDRDGGVAMRSSAWSA
jgi:hypothetical protein